MRGKSLDGRCLLLLNSTLFGLIPVYSPRAATASARPGYYLLNGRFARWRVNRPASKLVRTSLLPKVTKLGLGLKLRRHCLRRRPIIAEPAFALAGWADRSSLADLYWSNMKPRRWSRQRSETAYKGYTSTIREYSCATV